MNSTVTILMLIFTCIANVVLGIACIGQPNHSKTASLQKNVVTSADTTNITIKIDQPRFTRDEVIEWAKQYSPECRVKVGVSMIVTGGG